MLSYEIKTTSIYDLINNENLVDREYKNIIMEENL